MTDIPRFTVPLNHVIGNGEVVWMRLVIVVGGEPAAIAVELTRSEAADLAQRLSVAAATEPEHADAVRAMRGGAA